MGSGACFEASLLHFADEVVGVGLNSALGRT